MGSITVYMLSSICNSIDSIFIHVSNTQFKGSRTTEKIVLVCILVYLDWCCVYYFLMVHVYMTAFLALVPIS